MGRRGRPPSNPPPPSPEPHPQETHEPESPFPDLDDDGSDADDVLADLNDRNQEDLDQHEPSPIGSPQWGGTNPMGFDPFGNTGSTQGRPVSPKIWANAQLHPLAVQLRVWKLENGVPVLVGVIEKDANEEDFIRRFYPVMPKSGEGYVRFQVRPIGMDGGELRQEISLPPISEHHTVLRQIRTQEANASAALQAALPPTQPSIDLTRFENMLERAQVIEQARILRLEDEARADRQRMQVIQEQTAKERIELAERAAMSQEGITERLMASEDQRAQRAIQAEAARNQAHMGAMTSAFAQLTTQQIASQERERAEGERRLREEDARRDRMLRDEEVRREREGKEWERKVERERAEYQQRWDREKYDMEQKAASAEAERSRNHALRLEEMRIAQERDRQYNERMLTLNTQREKGESLEGIVEKGLKLAATFGLKPNDIAEKILGGDKEGTDWSGMLDVLGKALVQGIATGGEVLKENMRTRQTQQLGMVQMNPVPPPYPVIPQALLGPTAPAQPAAGAGTPAPEGSVAQPAAAPAPAPVPEPVIDLPLPTQKLARDALRKLVGNLRKNPQDKWQEVVGLSVGGEMSIYHYTKATSIRYALKEGGADDAFINTFLEHPAAGMIPEDVPRG